MGGIDLMAVTLVLKGDEDGGVIVGDINRERGWALCDDRLIR